MIHLTQFHKMLANVSNYETAILEKSTSGESLELDELVETTMELVVLKDLMSLEHIEEFVAALMLEFSDRKDGTKRSPLFSFECKCLLKSDG